MVESFIKAHIYRGNKFCSALKHYNEMHLEIHHRIYVEGLWVEYSLFTDLQRRGCKNVLQQVEMLTIVYTEVSNWIKRFAHIR